MSKYITTADAENNTLTGIGREMYTCASEMGASLRFFQENTNPEELEEEQTKFFENMAKAFIYGNPISSRSGFAPLNLPHLPERTGNAETDLQNFNDYFQEFFNELPNVSGYEFLSFKEDLENAFNTYVQKNPLKDFAKVTGTAPSFSNARFLINSVLDDDHRLSGEHIQAEKMNRFTLFRTISFNHAIRKEPEWYEFGKRFNMWREKRALERLENNLKALGFSQEILDNVKQLKTDGREKVERNIKDGPLDRMNRLNEVFLKNEKKLDQEFVTSFDSTIGKNFITTVMKTYQLMKTFHDMSEPPTTDDGKKYYQQEAKFLEEMKIKIKNTMEIVTPEDKKFFDSLFEKDADVNQLFKAREKANRPIEKEIVDFDEKIFEDDSLDRKMNKAIYTREKQIDALDNQQEKENQQLNNNILQDDENEVQGPQQG